MRTIIVLFFSSLFFSLVLTPLVRAASLKLNLVDLPSGRKVHTTAISRMGGVAVFFSFLAATALLFFADTTLALDLVGDEKFYWLVAGGLIVFITGLVDDATSLNAVLKLVLQIVAASVAYYCGIRITVITVPFVEHLSTGILCYPVTILWFLLIINAVNLIDGLDGLAAGVSLLVCAILTLFAATAGNYPTAAVLAAMSGAILGFLKYNFNPASIFMGDSGSYFIGYMIAGLSLYGSIKSHTAATLFITVLALGIPLADTIIATFRRYMLGKKIFSPDRTHFHHQLLKIGFSHRNAVLVLYFSTLGLCLAAVSMVYLNDRKSAIVLLVVALTMIVGIRKLGYLNHLHFKGFLRWTSDLQDGLGITRGRRQFLARQVAIHEAEDMDEFRLRLTQALQMMDVDYFKLELGGRGCNFKNFQDYIWHGEAESEEHTDEFNRRLFVAFPIEYNNQFFGRLTTSKENFVSSPDSDITLRRIEILRRTISRTLYDKKAITAFEMYDRRKADNAVPEEENQREAERRKGERRIYNRRSEDRINGKDNT